MMNARVALRVAAVQLNSQTNVGENLATSARLVSEAGRRGADLVLLPENFAYLGPEAGRRQLAEPLGNLDAPIQRALADMARRDHLVVVGGGFPEQSDDPERPYNTCAGYSPQGELLASYRKIHLFDIDLPQLTHRESDIIQAGDRLVVTQTPLGRLGLATCYDLRFPELFRRLSSADAQLFCIPAAFSVATGREHWEPLLRARAIENQAYVIAPNQFGRHNSTICTCGHSMIVDPWGTPLAIAPDGEGVVTAEIDLERQAQIRRQLPALQHRRDPHRLELDRPS